MPLFHSPSSSSSSKSRRRKKSRARSPSSKKKSRARSSSSSVKVVSHQENGTQSIAKDLQRVVVDTWKLDEKDFEEEHHFIYEQGKGTQLSKLGAIKLALSTKGRFPDDGWLDRNSTWSVAYHGTNSHTSIMKGILKNGLKVRGGDKKSRVGEKYGKGVYVSPDPKVAATFCDVPIPVGSNAPQSLQKHKAFHVVLQCRVRRFGYKKTAAKYESWLVPNEKDVRITGVILLETRKVECRHGKLYVDCRDCKKGLKRDHSRSRSRSKKKKRSRSRSRSRKKEKAKEKEKFCVGDYARIIESLSCPALVGKAVQIDSWSDEFKRWRCKRMPPDEAKGMIVVAEHQLEACAKPPPAPHAPKMIPPPAPKMIPPPAPRMMPPPTPHAPNLNPYLQPAPTSFLNAYLNPHPQPLPPPSFLVPSCLLPYPS